MPKITANGINLYYEIHGQGEAVVFVAGFSADHGAWQNIIADFTKSHQVVVFDNRGIGQSDCPDYPYTIEMMADDAIGLVKALQLGPAHFIGHSGGGYIVQNIVYKYPELVKSAVIANAFNKMDVLGVLYAKTRLEMIQAKVPNKFIVKFITMLCWSKKYLSQPGKFDKLVEGSFYPITLQGYKHQLNAMLNFDSSSWLDAIKKPCLIIGADEDLLASAEQVQQMASAIPNAEYFCFENVGHVPMVEQPEVFNKLVLKFIKRKNHAIK
jgi:3-oxoadipate enol-lactonase